MEWKKVGHSSIMDKNMSDYSGTQFDPDWYKSEYPDVVHSGLTPEEHYEKYGKRFGRLPNPASKTGNTDSTVSESQTVHELQEIPDNSVCYLVPISHLTSKGEGSWLSTGDDPFFIVDLGQDVQDKSGWLRIVLEINSDSGYCNGKFYLDLGSGFNEHHTIWLSCKNNTEQRIIRFFDQSIKGIRFDPSEEPGLLTLKKLDISLCEPDEAINEMAHNISKEHPEFQHLSSNEIIDKYSTSFSQMDTLYRQYLRIEDQGFHLIPHNQVSYRSGKQWISTGSDPFFLIPDHDLSELHSGWYKFLIRIRTDGIDDIAKFYVNTGKGFNENEVMDLPYQNGDVVERYYYINHDLVGVRFDPLEREGLFAVEWLSITKESSAKAVYEIANRIALYHPGYRGTVEDVLQQFTGSADPEKVSISESMVKAYGLTFTANASRVDYLEWISQVEQGMWPEPSEIHQTLSELNNKPIISIVIHTYNTPRKFLRECIEAIIEQSYPYWQLCIADDLSTDKDTINVLKSYEAKDKRIKVHFRTENGHISAATNSALEIATGDYVAFVDHDDILNEHALYFMALAFHKYPKAKIFYSDEDKIDEYGNRFDPHFKGGWNPDLLLSQNYISHLGVYDRALVDQVGGLRKGVEGSQDYDLLLRCLPHIEDKDVIHVPKILYHWRGIEGSTALAAGEKTYTTNAGLRALNDYLKSINVTQARVKPGKVPNSYKVGWPIPDKEPLVSLIMPTKDQVEMTELAVWSILDKTQYSNFEILIIDNGSVEAKTKDFFDRIQTEDGRVRVLSYNYPFNYSALNNFGVSHAKGEIIGMINNDIEVISPEWLTEMVSQAIRPEVGCVGAKLYYSDGSIQHAGIVTGLGGVAGHPHKHFPRDHFGYFSKLMLVQDIMAVTAACLLVRRDVYEQVEGLNEIDLTVAFNDVDFCLKVHKAGFRNVWTPYAELYHHESISRGKEDSQEKIERFQGEEGYMKTTWAQEIHEDPYYNINLTRDKDDFSIAMPK